jgi:hypothetical protein
LAEIIYFNLYKGVFVMPRRIFFIVGVLIGFLFAEVLRRKSMERLAAFDAEKVARKAMYEQLEKERQAYVSSLPPDAKLEIAMWEAQMEANGWELEEEDDET